MKQLIHGATIYDGSGGAPFQADVVVENGRVARMEQGLAQSALEAERIDASGLALTPGFIDMHRHCDIAPFQDPDFGHLELAQGITATTVGNCGIACVPVSPEHRWEYRDFVAPVMGHAAPEQLFQRYEDYFDALRQARPALHMGVLAGTGAIKVAVKGFADTPYTPQEMERAQKLVAEAMATGALGVSLGFMYQPESYTTPREQKQVIAPAAAAGGLLTTHIRGEGDSLVDSVDEVIRIAQEAGIRLHISHFKATGIRNWRRTIFGAMEAIEKANAASCPVTVDFYPYAGGSTTVFSLIPPTVMKSGNEVTLAYLATPQGKRALREAIAAKHPGWDNMALSIGWDRILIAGTSLPQHSAYGGRSVSELAREAGYGEPSDFLCDLVVAEEGKVGIIVMSMDQRDVDDVARLPYAAVISDALYGGGENPHPRLYGAFARMIADFVVKRRVLPLETAVRKMTGMPAGILGLRDRGLLKVGAVADLNLFDPQEVRDHATYNDSRRLSTGMRRVWLGGKTVFTQEKLLERHAGEILTRG